MILNNFNMVYYNKYIWELKDKFWNSVKKIWFEGEFLIMMVVIL